MTTANANKYTYSNFLFLAKTKGGIWQCIQDDGFLVRRVPAELLEGCGDEDTLDWCNL